MKEIQLWKELMVSKLKEQIYEIVDFEQALGFKL